MADHSKPTVTSTYTNFVTEIDQRLDEISKWFKSSNVTSTYIPQNTVRWNDTTYKWEINQATDGTQTPSWAEFSNRYDININGTVGATTPTTGSFTTISTSGVANLGAGSTVGAVDIVTTTGTQTLTNKTLTAPVISTISNTGTLTLPTATTTLVGTNTTDTLTNKTLTAPRFVDTGFIADSNGNELLEFGLIASAVNNLKVTNAATGSTPIIEATGGDTNVNLNLRGKGTGIVTIGSAAVQVADISTTQTLTNKTLGTGSIWNGGTIGNTYGGTGNTSAFTQGGVTYASSGTVLATSAQGTTGQLLQSGGTSAPSWISASSLSVGFATNASTVSNLSVHTARNNEANKIVRTDGSGYVQFGYINSSSGNENNNTNADRVWGTNGVDDYLRTYRTSALIVGTAINPTFSGDSVDKDNITSRTDSGFYQTSSGTTGEGWPVNDGTWQHLIACTHANDSNYYSMQIAGSFYDQNLYFRKTNGNGTTGWRQILTDQNISSYASARMPEYVYYWVWGRNIADLSALPATGTWLTPNNGTFSLLPSDDAANNMGGLEYANLVRYTLRHFGLQTPFFPASVYVARKNNGVWINAENINNFAYFTLTKGEWITQIGALAYDTGTGGGGVSDPGVF